MKPLKIALIFISLLLGYISSFAQTKIMSYNIRYDTQNDGENRWDLRKDELVKLLEYYNPDFIGMQEAMPHQFKFIAEHLDDYNYVGHGRDGLYTDSEATPIFYDFTKYQLLTKDLFWLSSTPKKISKGWDAALNRIVVYAKFKSRKTNQNLFKSLMRLTSPGSLGAKIIPPTSPSTTWTALGFMVRKTVLTLKGKGFGVLYTWPISTPIK